MAKEDGSFERDLVTQVQDKDHKGAVRIGSEPLDADVEDFVSTQCATLDWALGRGGFPVGRMSLLLGEEATAKSTVLLHALIETQRRGGTAILVDAENRYSKERSTAMGMEHDRLIYVTGDQPYEDMLASMISLADKARAKDPHRLITIGFDSIAAVASRKSIEECSQQLGEIAGITSRWFAKHHSTLAAKNICLVMVNQWRSKINTFGGWGDKKTMLAEGSLKFYASCRIEFKKVKAIGPEKAPPVAILVKAEVTKNTVADPYRTAEFLCDFRIGIDFPGSQLILAKQFGIVSVTGGGYYKMEGRDKKFRASEFEAVLDEHPELVERLITAPTAVEEEKS